FSFTEARVLVVVSSGGVGLLAVHWGSGSWQVPTEEVTTLLTWVVLGGSGVATVTVKWTTTEVGSVALFAGPTVTAWVQGVPAGEAGALVQVGPQPSLPGPVEVVLAGTSSLRGVVAAVPPWVSTVIA